MSTQCIEVYLPDEIYSFLINALLDENKLYTTTSYNYIYHGYLLKRKPREFFEHLNEIPDVDKIINDLHKKKEKLKLQQDIANAAERHKQLLEKLKEFEND